MTSRERPGPRPRRWRPTLFVRFATLSFVSIAALALAMGFALSTLLRRAVSAWEWENTAAVVRRETDVNGLAAFFAAPGDAASREAWGRRLAEVLAGLPEVVRVKAWDRSATVLWSDEAQLIGQRFPDNAELREALAGRVAVQIKALAKAEQRYERDAFGVLAEVYVPIYQKGGSEVVGVLEVYKIPARLLSTVRRGQALIWLISLAGGLVLYVVMMPLVRQVYGREVREEALWIHAERLEAEVAARTAEVRRQSQQLTQAQRMEALGLLAGGAAHDFNNLLTVILGRAELILSRLPADDALRRHVTLLHETARRATSLTGQLLAFSRSRARDADVVDVNAVVAGLAPMLRRLVPADIALVTELAPDVRRVKVDAAHVEQVVLNLVVNARDAMPGGGRLVLRTATAEVDALEAGRRAGARPGRYVTVAVADTGVGMSREMQARVFEPFFTTKEPGRGSGIGLATVYGIVKQSRGTIWLDSEPGRGSTFTVYLPATDELPEPAVELPRPATLPRGSETILLVEDEEAVRELVRETLGAQGYVAIEARHGAEALVLAERHAGPIDLVLTDVVMPGLGGRELVERLQGTRPGLRALFISGYGADTLVRRGALRYGAEYLAKPFTAAALATRVRRVLDRRDPEGAGWPPADRPPGPAAGAGEGVGAGGEVFDRPV
jgi:signal transduction histidine kinase/ActR/RegA family two-component response regulator